MNTCQCLMSWCCTHASAPSPTKRQSSTATSARTKCRSKLARAHLQLPHTYACIPAYMDVPPDPWNPGSHRCTWLLLRDAVYVPAPQQHLACRHCDDAVLGEGGGQDRLGARVCFRHTQCWHHHATCTGRCRVTARRVAASQCMAMQPPPPPPQLCVVRARRSAPPPPRARSPCSGTAHPVAATNAPGRKRRTVADVEVDV
jgi:hypothetical protein